MGLRTGDIELAAGEFIIVPKGIEHRPDALTEECSVILLEPKSALNTGIVTHERTVRALQRPKAGAREGTPPSCPSPWERVIGVAKRRSPIQFYGGSLVS